jgi:hypothetical protein
MKHLTKQLNPSPAFLVALDGTHALVDAASEQLVVLNDAAAILWRELHEGGAPRTAADIAFVDELVQLGLLPVAVCAGADPSESDGEQPQILAIAPLQVAAGTSDPNPFSADPSW